MRKPHCAWHAPCAGRSCSAMTGDLNISGPHCTDYSMQGAKQGKLGPSVPFFLTLVREIKARRTKVVILENVASPEFAELVSLVRMMDIMLQQSAKATACRNS